MKNIIMMCMLLLTSPLHAEGTRSELCTSLYKLSGIVWDARQVGVPKDVLAGVYHASTDETARKLALMTLDVVYLEPITTSRNTVTGKILLTCVQAIK